MKIPKKRIRRGVAIVLTFVVLRGLLRLLAGDYTTSLIPGWHTSIYWTEASLSIGAMVVLLIAAFTIGLFRLIEKVIRYIRIAIETKKQES